MTSAGSQPPAADARAPSVAAEYRFAAFISYRHGGADAQWARWLHWALESYRTPRQLVANGAPERVRPVFRDEEELAASADLSASIREALRDSHFLIVVCSPRTPASRWVNEEVKYFRALGRGERILTLLVEGEPAGAFPPALLEAPAPGARAVEPLAADVRPGPHERPRRTKELARLRLLAPILGCRFDELRQREHERQRRRWLQLSGVLAALLAVMAALTLVAVWQWRRADSEARRATAQLLAAQAQLELETTPASEAIGTTGYQRAALLALESLAVQPTVQGDRALRSALARLPGMPYRVQPVEHEAILAIGPGGERLLSLRGDTLLLRSRGGTGAPDVALLPLAGDGTGDDTATLPAVAEFSPDGRFVATLDPTQVRIWQTEPAAVVASLGLAESVDGMQFAPASTRLLLWGEHGVHEWDWAAKTSRERRLHGHALRLATPSGDGRWFAAMDSTQAVVVYTLDQGLEAPAASLRAADDVGLIALSHDGRRIAIGGFGSVQVRDRGTGRVLAALPHEWSLQAMRFSRDGRHLATVTFNVSRDPADLDATELRGSIVRVWDIDAASELTRIPLAEEGGVTRTAFSPDGGWLLTETHGGEALWFWNLWPEPLRREACSRLTRNLSAPEARRALGREEPPRTCPDRPIPDDDGSYETEFDPQ